MNSLEFNKVLDNYTNKLNIELNKKQIEQLYTYMNMLIEWNEKINLTAITEPSEIVLKHFIDSFTINEFIKENAYVADVGSGAGFPGIPIKILRKDINLVLVDSLNKRIKFLDEVIEKLGLDNVKTVHARAEEFGQNKNYREKFDIVTSRAVANLSTLSEYLIPLSAVGGKVLAMKGPGAKEEIENSKNAIKILGGTIFYVKEFKLPNSDIERTIVEINKISSTNSKYPRKAGVPSKEPL